MKILIVEDDEGKSAALAAFIIEWMPNAEIELARSLTSGLRAALRGEADLMLLDMTMANYDRSLRDDRGRPHHFAGREILRQLQREEVVLPTVVVTQFGRFGEEAEEVTLSELQVELATRFTNYLGTVHYRSNVDDWKDRLKIILDTQFLDGI